MKEIYIERIKKLPDFVQDSLGESADVANINFIFMHIFCNWKCLSLKSNSGA